MQGYVIEGDALKEWLRTHFVDDEGEIYLPCGAFGDERTAHYCLLHDRVPYVHEQRHLYAPVTWLISHHRQHADTIRAMAAQIRRRHAEAQSTSLQTST